MEKQSDKVQNVVQLLTSLGVNIKKTKSRFDVMRTLPNSKPATNELK